MGESSRIYLHLCCVFFCVLKPVKVTLETLYIYRWGHCWDGECQCYVMSGSKAPDPPLLAVLSYVVSADFPVVFPTVHRSVS